MSSTSNKKQTETFIQTGAKILNPVPGIHFFQQIIPPKISQTNYQLETKYSNVQAFCEIFLTYTPTLGFFCLNQLLKYTHRNCSKLILIGILKQGKSKI